MRGGTNQGHDTDSNSNYLGTYVASLEAFDAHAGAANRRLGDPRLSYSNVQGGIYIQDDIKIRKNFTVTGGVRYERRPTCPTRTSRRAGFTGAVQERKTRRAAGVFTTGLD
jgi:outer membrane receptor protein involved in Fe transport